MWDVMLVIYVSTIFDYPLNTRYILFNLRVCFHTGRYYFRIWIVIEICETCLWKLSWVILIIASSSPIRKYSAKELFVECCLRFQKIRRQTSSRIRRVTTAKCVLGKKRVFRQDDMQNNIPRLRGFPSAKALIPYLCESLPQIDRSSWAQAPQKIWPQPLHVAKRLHPKVPSHLRCTLAAFATVGCAPQLEQSPSESQGRVFVLRTEFCSSTAVPRSLRAHWEAWKMPFTLEMWGPS